MRYAIIIALMIALAIAPALAGDMTNGSGNRWERALVDGNRYAYSNSVSLLSSIAAPYDLFINATSSSKTVIMRICGAPQSSTLFQLHEGPSVSAVGNAQVLTNLNRMSANAATVAISNAPTVVSTGPQIAMWETNFRDIPFDDCMFGPVVINSSLDYLLRATNRSGATNFTTFRIEWIEYPAGMSE